MPTFRLPLSGDVTQTINPWNWFVNMLGNQFGLININLGKSSDPQLEEQILNDVGSYGRQIGQIGDALQVLIRHANLTSLSTDEQRALNALQFQLDEVNRIKYKRLQSALAGSATVAEQSSRD
ncbi:MAG: hypothetical protein ACLP2F_04550 [Steroidobacteraceae bacterium]